MSVSLYHIGKLSHGELGKGVGNYGGAVQQALLSQQFPDGFVPWGGRTVPCELRVRYPAPKFAGTIRP